MTEAVEATTTTPAKPAVCQTFYFSGQVVLSSSKGVTCVTTPVLKSDLSVACEWDMYNYLLTMVNQVEFAVLRPIRINPKTIPANHSKNQTRAQWA